MVIIRNACLDIFHKYLDKSWILVTFNSKLIDARILYVLYARIDN